MRRGTRWLTTSWLAWGLATVLVVAGSVVAGAAAPVETQEAESFPVVVEGPGFAQPENECFFWAHPQGGTSPFTYQWQWPATGTSSLGRAIMPSQSSVVVAVDVWDSVGQHGTGQITVQLDPSNEPCEI